MTEKSMSRADCLHAFLYKDWLKGFHKVSFIALIQASNCLANPVLSKNEAIHNRIVHTWKNGNMNKGKVEICPKKYYPAHSYNQKEPSYFRSKEKIFTSLFLLPFIREAIISPATWLKVIPLPPNPSAKKLLGNFL